MKIPLYLFATIILNTSKFHQLNVNNKTYTNTKINLQFPKKYNTNAKK